METMSSKSIHNEPIIKIETATDAGIVTPEVNKPQWNTLAWIIRTSTIALETKKH